ncbi:MAG: hypothetical protein F4X25_13435 [Chloroflexi bacterium]|nr:hypothetical protein [Chloroflexota bacterium]
MPDPNEIIHTWENQNDLFRSLQPAIIEAVSALVESESTGTVVFHPSLVDADGRQLKFPIRLVSRTEFEPPFEDEDGNPVPGVAGP